MALGIVGQRAREELVPGGEARRLALDLQGEWLVPREEMPFARIGNHPAGLGRDQRLHARGDIALAQGGQHVGKAAAGAGLARDRGFQRQPHLFQLDGDVDAGILLQPDGAAEGGVLVDPGLDGIKVAPDAERREPPLPARIAQRRHRRAPPLMLVGRSPQQLDR
jgi:hypothetical protein